MGPLLRLRSITVLLLSVLVLIVTPVAAAASEPTPLPEGDTTQAPEPSREIHSQPVTGAGDPIFGEEAGSEKPHHDQPVTQAGDDPLQLGDQPPVSRPTPRPDATAESLSGEEPLPVEEGAASIQDATDPDAPVGVNDHYEVANDAVLSINAPGFLANDVDLDGEALTATSIADSPDNGSLAAFPDGSFTYTPDAGFVGTDTWQYVMRDESSNFSDPVTVTIEVLPAANRDPIGSDDAYTMLADTTLSIDSPGFLANDVDPDGEALTATSIADSPDNGSLAAFPDGSFTYTPDAGFVGTDTWQYVMRDESSNFSDPVTVTIEVFEGNRDPIGVDDHYAAVVDTPLSIDAPGFLANDLDVDGEALTAASIADSPDNGSLAAFPDGSFTYTPDAGFVGTDTWQYVMRDESSNFSEPVTVTIDVHDAGTTPVGVDDVYRVANDAQLSVDAPGFLANDVDLDGEALTAASIADAPDHGSLAAFPDGSFTYTPDDGFVGTDTWQYVMRDESSNSSDPVTVTIDVLPAANRAPIGADDLYTMQADTTMSVASPGFLANDVDLDGEALTAASIADAPDNGSLAAFPDGSFTYTPDDGFVGTDTWQYVMRDDSSNFSDPVTVTIEVVQGNRDPIGVDDLYAVATGGTLSIDAPGFLANDVDLDGEALTATSIADSPDNGSLAAFPDGSFTYTPDAGFVGTDSFQYEMRDESSNRSDPVTVTIDVLDPNVAPAAVDDHFDATEDMALDIAAPGVLGNDTDANGDPLEAVGNTDPADGSVALNADGSFSYTPDPDFCGTDAFDYTVSDDAGATDSAAVTIDVECVNDPPVAVDDDYSTTEGNALDVDAPGALDNDNDVDGDELVVDSHDATSAAGGSVVVAAGGAFTYTPAAGFAGTDSFSYTATDGNGGFDTAVVTIAVDATHNRGINVDLVEAELDGALLSGLVEIDNDSGKGLTVQVIDTEVTAEYRVPGDRAWTEVGVNSCSFDPAPDFVVDDSETITFSDCVLAEAIPDDAAVRVTAGVQIFGRIKGAGSPDGWFYDSLTE